MNLLADPDTEQLLARLRVIRFPVHACIVSPLQTVPKRENSKLGVVYDLSFPEGVSLQGAPFTYFNDGGREGGGIRQRFIFYTPKNPNFRVCLPKKIPTFFSIPKKIPQCFCIGKCYYSSSRKYPQKIPVLFS